MDGGDGEGLLPECSVGYLELRQQKLKHMHMATYSLFAKDHQWQVVHSHAVQILVVEVASGKNHA